MDTRSRATVRQQQRNHQTAQPADRQATSPLQSHNVSIITPEPHVTLQSVHHTAATQLDQRKSGS